MYMIIVSNRQHLIHLIVAISLLNLDYHYCSNYASMVLFQVAWRQRRRDDLGQGPYQQEWGDTEDAGDDVE